MRYRKVILLILAGLIGFCVYLIITQSYPVALVNWRPITLKSFGEDSDVALHYYQKLLETYDKNQIALLDSSEVRREIKRAVLEQLIENSLIQQELGKQIKSGELKKMIDNKIQEALKDKDIGKEIETLYALSLDEFRENVLKPQTEREIITGRLFLQNINFDDWLKETKKQARVVILLPGFQWNEEGTVQ